MSDFDIAKLGNTIKKGVTEGASALAAGVQSAAQDISDFVNVDGFAKPKNKTKRMLYDALAKLE